MNFTIETEQEADGRWIAEVVELAGVMKYGSTRAEAIAQAEALALREMAERIENGSNFPLRSDRTKSWSETVSRRPETVTTRAPVHGETDIEAIPLE
jgi:predicted RNase H-like HicB family nuclease